MYNGYPGVGEKANLPRPWQFPDGQNQPYALAPIAGFPSYSFSVSRGGGLNLAVPSQAVPIGLSLLGGDAANGTITLKETYTYGIPAPALDEALERFTRTHAAFLTRYAPQSRTVNGKQVIQPFYLRIVHRVYLVRTIDVQLAASRGFGAALSAGTEAPKPLALDQPAKVSDTLKALNEGLAKLPANPSSLGGSVQFKMATDRSVSLEETFPRPLVFGYLATQCEIGSDGLRCGPELALLQKAAGSVQRAKVTFTVVPGTPRSASETRSIFTSEPTLSVSTFATRSPSWTPPSSAGVWGNTVRTMTLVPPPFFCSSSSMPTPP
jgi:hypothetical protein